MPLPAIQITAYRRFREKRGLTLRVDCRPTTISHVLWIARFERCICIMEPIQIYQRHECTDARTHGRWISTDQHIHMVEARAKRTLAVPLCAASRSKSLDGRTIRWDGRGCQGLGLRADRLISRCQMVQQLMVLFSRLPKTQVPTGPDFSSFPPRSHFRCTNKSMGGEIGPRDFRSADVRESRRWFDRDSAIVQQVLCLVGLLLLTLAK